MTHSITLGSGNAPILTTDPTLLCPTEPLSFHLEDGVTVGSIYTTNWKFDSDSLAAAMRTRLLSRGSIRPRDVGLGGL